MPFVPDTSAPTAGRFVPDDVPRGASAPPDEPSVVAGIPGAIAAVGLSLPGQLYGNLYGAYKRATGSSMEEASKAAAEKADALAYHPSPAGEAALKKASPLLDALIAVQGAMGMTPFRAPTARESARGRPSAPAIPEESPVEAPAKAATPPDVPFPVEAARPDEKAVVRPPGPPKKPVAEEPPPHPFPEEAGDLSTIGRFVPDETPVERPPEPPALELTGQTEAEIRAEESKANRAAADAARIEAAPPPEEFKLAGSDSPADQARAAGQMELAPAEEPKLPAEPRFDRERVVPELDSLSTIMGKLGGVRADELLRDGMDEKTLRDLRSSVVGKPAWRRNGGLSLDGMGERLAAYGFDVYDERGLIDATKVRELIESEANGDTVYTGAGYEYQASKQAEHAAREAEKEARARGELTQDEALAAYGPGTLGSTQFLDPAVIGKAAQDTVRDLFGEPGEHRHDFNPIRDREQHNVARIGRWAAGRGHEIRETFPSKEAREKLTIALVKDDFSGLTPEQAATGKRLQAWYRAMGEYAVDAARIEGLRENYSPQIWDLNDKSTRQLIEAWAAERGAPGVDMNGMLAQAMRDAGSDPQAFTPFMLQRSISDVIEGMRIGLKPKSLDAADLFETYARSMGTAVERGKALNSLKSLVFEDGTMAVIDREKAPRDYVKVDNPELEGMRVHPDIAPSVRVLMETNNPGVVATIAQTMAYTAKRALVSYSFFHPKALLEAFVGSGGNPLTAKSAIDAALKQYREGGIGDVIDVGLANGLKIGAPLEDVLGRDKFQGLFDKAANIADKVGAGKPIRLAKEADEAIQKATWDYLHTGLKLETFSRKYGDLLEKNAEKVGKGEMSEKEIARQAAEFTNAVYGGLNWERMLDHFETPVARRIMSEILSKQGRSWMSTFMFAPDWAISTFGSWTNALGVSERNALKRELGQRYLVTSAVVTLAIGNAMNYYFTGHSMFDNKSEKKNATMGDQLKAKMEVQLGDGRRMQIAKHFMEVPHAAVAPVQFAMNKVNPVVAEPLEQAFNKQWLSPGWTPPITKPADTNMQAAVKRAGHAAGKFVPITGRQLMEQGPSGLGGFFGFPVYGMTEEQKRKARAER